MTVSGPIFAALLALFPPCPTEDSSLCGWNAQAQGNGTGRSFVALSDSLIIRAGTPIFPPPEFDHPYPGKVDLFLVDGSNTWAECTKYGGMKGIPFKVGGCAWFAEDGTCVVFVAMRSPRATVDDLIRHEIGHCNGWPADHPM